MKYKLLGLLAGVALFSSCATIFNSKTQKVNFYGLDEDSKMILNDSIYNLPTRVEIKRSKEPLKIQYITDKTSSHDIHRYFSFAYVPGNIFLNYASGIGFLVDIKTPKKYAYKNNIVLAHDLPTNKSEQAAFIGDKLKNIEKVKMFAHDREKKLFDKHFNIQTGDFFHTIQLPSLTFFNFDNQNLDSNVYGGLFSVGYGFEKFYTNKKFWGVYATLRTNRFDLIISELAETYDDIYEVSLALTNNHVISPRWSVGYGIRGNYNMNHYEEYYFTYTVDDIILRQNVDKVKNYYLTLGAEANIQFKLNKGFYLGYTHGQQFYKFSTNENTSYFGFSTGIDFKYKF